MGTTDGVGSSASARWGLVAPRLVMGFALILLRWTSAAVAILTGEPDADNLIERISDAIPRLMSTGTLLELSIVMEARLGPAGQGVVERFVRDSEIELVPVERTHVDRALEGWRRFGTGRHKAALNFGDCFSYALAIASGYPLLYIGNDFTHTDILTTNEEPG